MAFDLVECMISAKGDKAKMIACKVQHKESIKKTGKEFREKEHYLFSDMPRDESDVKADSIRTRYGELRDRSKRSQYGDERRKDVIETIDKREAAALKKNEELFKDIPVSERGQPTDEQIRKRHGEPEKYISASPGWIKWEGETDKPKWRTTKAERDWKKKNYAEYKFRDELRSYPEGWQVGSYIVDKFPRSIVDPVTGEKPFSSKQRMLDLEARKPKLKRMKKRKPKPIERI